MADWENLRLSADPGPSWRGAGAAQRLRGCADVGAPLALSAVTRGTEVLIWALIFIAEVRLIKRMNLTSSGRGATLAAYDLEGLTRYADARQCPPGGSTRAGRLWPC